MFYISETQFSLTIHYQELTNLDTSLFVWNANTKKDLQYKISDA